MNGIGEGRRLRQRALVVAGVMSGTSADGVDVALCRIEPRRTAPRVEVLAHAQTAYPKALRIAVLRAMTAGTTTVPELSRLSWRLGEFYAACVTRATADARLRIDLVGCHGQTIYHQSAAREYLGSAVRCTWQTGEAAVLAERMHCPVVSGFRAADMAAGGEGAPLVPMLDWALFGSPRVHRVLQNLGGIANLSVVPAKAALEDVVAFDTGPANMVIDACMRRLYGREFDRAGAVARSGSPVAAVLRGLLRHRYFRLDPPKSCGREQFGEPFADTLIARCRQSGTPDADIVATATALTVRSVLEAYTRFVLPRLAPGRVEVVLSGGGAKNATLVRGLTEGLRAHGVELRPIADLGVATEAKEAAAFALLAWLTWHRMAGNVVGATGAQRPVVLGQICFG